MTTNHQLPSAKIREHHQELLSKLARVRETIDRLERGEMGEVNEGLRESVKFFDAELRPHAEWEEDNLYPPVGELLKRYGSPTATMEVDHDAIVGRIDRFRNDVAAFLSLSGRPKEREQLTRQLIRNAWQLEAIVSLHFTKEEDVYLPLVDSHMTAKEVEKLLGGEH